MNEEAKVNVKKIWKEWNEDEELQIDAIKLSENHTYKLQQHEAKWILRLTPTYHRSMETIEAEIYFIEALHKGGLKVGNPIHSKQQTYINKVEKYGKEGEEWYGVLFKHVAGTTCIPNWRGLTDLKIVEEWGKALGQLHRIVAKKGYEEKEGEGEIESWNKVIRGVPNWDETHAGALKMQRIEELKGFHKIGEEVHRRWVAVLEKMKEVPRTAATYGVTHGDLNVSNFFYEEGEGEEKGVWMFDFDQFQMNYFLADVAVVMFGVYFFDKMDYGGVKACGFKLENFKEAFLRGYQSEYDGLDMSASWMDVFLEFRILYNTSVSLDLLEKFESGKQHFEDSIVSFVKVIIQLFE